MSLVSKQRFLKEIEKILGDSVPKSSAESIVNRIEETLGKYEIESVAAESTDSDTAEFLDSFLSAKIIEGRSEKTVERYRYVLGRLFESLETPIRDITVFGIRAYLMSEKSRGISDSTLEGYREIYSSFFGWLQKEGLLTANPCANLSPIKCAKKVRTPYASADVERLKEVCVTDRDRAIVSFLASTGCRISEVCALDIDDIDLARKECTVIGKGNKERVVFIDDVATMHLKRYLDNRVDHSKALFSGRGTDRMTPSGMRARLKTLSGLSGIENVHPHRFRRTLATNLISHGMPIQEVASILGHDKLDTTMKYVYLCKDDIHNSYRRCS